MVLSSERCFVTFPEDLRKNPSISKSVVRGLIYHCRTSPFQQFAINSSCLSRQRGRSHSAVIQVICKGPENVVGERETIWDLKADGENPQSYFLIDPDVRRLL